jgi:hypothetical protein
MKRMVDAAMTIITAVSFIATIVSLATTKQIALIIAVTVLGLCLIYLFIRFIMGRVPLKRHQEYVPFERFLSDAEKVDIIGINLAGIVSGYQGIIEKKAKDGCKFRFIIVNPKLTESIPMSSQTRRNTENTFDLLKKIMAKTNRNIELGLFKYIPVYSLLIKHRDIESQGVVQVEIYSQIELFSEAAMAHTRPHFVLTQRSSKYWYKYFCNEFEDAYKNSTHIEL